MNSFENFSGLHQGATPLLLGNIWDVSSAKMFETCGYKAIGTSSHAVANTFGYEDGEQLEFENLFRLAKRVAQVVSIPLSIDIEGGFSRTPEGIIENIRRLHDVGVVGVNLEDTIAGAARQFQSIIVRGILRRLGIPWFMLNWIPFLARVDGMPISPTSSTSSANLHWLL